LLQIGADARSSRLLPPQMRARHIENKKNPTLITDEMYLRTSDEGVTCVKKGKVPYPDVHER